MKREWRRGESGDSRMQHPFCACPAVFYPMQNSLWSVVKEIYFYRLEQILRLLMEIPKPIMMKVVLVSITIYLAQGILWCKCRCPPRRTCNFFSGLQSRLEWVEELAHSLKSYFFVPVQSPRSNVGRSVNHDDFFFLKQVYLTRGLSWRGLSWRGLAFD